MPNWARVDFRGLWNESGPPDTEFKIRAMVRSEVEHSNSRSLKLHTILIFYEWTGKKHL